MCPFATSHLTACRNFTLPKGRHEPTNAFQASVATCIGVELINSACLFALASDVLRLRLCWFALLVLLDMLQSQWLVDIWPRCNIP